MNLSKGPLVNSSSEDNSKSAYGKCGAGAWRMHQSYDPLEANHMRDAHALYNPSSPVLYLFLTPLPRQLSIYRQDTACVLWVPAGRGSFTGRLDFRSSSFSSILP
ncbi:hypothetical protein FQA47_006757 [Oryzias melastigma]|uniref:Uncharacterized protein n=1 Tax=Oryzias melastigma TaxID=30732 RepID=A0A834FDZ8_ORYME|nr:hypothetical protein FQA47_006757 [Oryzias melastigma]